jgi:hypothetical protein
LGPIKEIKEHQRELCHVLWRLKRRKKMYYIMARMPKKERKTQEAIIFFISRIKKMVSSICARKGWAE